MVDISKNPTNLRLFYDDRLREITQITFYLFDKGGNLRFMSASNSNTWKMSQNLDINMKLRV